ncbi:hypothetical protein FJM67_13555 [Maribrevibacterium harenarium]|uniref:Outer membrane protein beta-barrel domain-containing protein n=1 Tax=Maribrevibacterium harenarium TaxID=2589817 RepID=A0A501WLY1_9GAMM|nr:hypothetical protein [Maribrevibacterium harenarium]TPE48237.1 hypothetical protein FJM67_13555 [Maribrevibacterium harenarium]
MRRQFYLAATGLALTTPAWGVTTESEFGLTFSQTYYVEPDIMEQRGQLFGVNGTFAQRQNAAVILEVEYSAGWVDYKGSGTMENIPDTLFETRVLLGKDWLAGNGYRVTPYLGLGYRFLTDDSTGMVSSDGSGGYRREQSYVYSPIGIAFTPAPWHTGWRLGATMEYDHFWYGNNLSTISAVCGGTDSYVSQDEGEGARVSLRLYSPRLPNRGRVIFETFYRYWSIADSTSNLVYAPRCHSNPSSEYYYEPHNQSEQFGLRLIWRS